MPTDPDAERRILDEIDMLVDESLARGDQSDSFHGEQMRENLPCPWCVQPWHFLKITVRMEEMRRGSYARDEFGQGIMDPDYRHDEDESIILCPGSEYHGPPHWIAGMKVWDKQGRERASEIAARQSYATQSADSIVPRIPPGRIRRLRFYGPFDAWTLSLDDDRDIEEIISDPASVGMPGERRRIPIVREQRLTATFELNAHLHNPPNVPAFIALNNMDIVRYHMTSDGYQFEMKPMAFPFRSFLTYAQNPTAREPDYVEFVTSYQIERHPWFMNMWTLSGTDDDIHLRPVMPPVPERRQGFESDYVIIDETHVWDDEHEEYWRQAYERSFGEGQGASAQADRELQRRPQVLRRGAQDSPRPHRQVAAAAQARAHEGAPGAADDSGEASSDEAGGA